MPKPCCAVERGIFYDIPTVNATQLAFGPPFKITNVVSGITVPINPFLYSPRQLPECLVRQRGGV